MTGNDDMRISVCGNVRWGGGDFSPLHFFPTADEIAILRMAERKDKARPFHIHFFLRTLLVVATNGWPQCYFGTGILKQADRELARHRVIKRRQAV